MPAREEAVHKIMDALFILSKNRPKVWSRFLEAVFQRKEEVFYRYLFGQIVLKCVMDHPSPAMVQKKMKELWRPVGLLWENMNEDQQQRVFSHMQTFCGMQFRIDTAQLMITFLAAIPVPLRSDPWTKIARNFLENYLSRDVFGLNEPVVRMSGFELAMQKEMVEGLLPLLTPLWVDLEHKEKEMVLARFMDPSLQNYVMQGAAKTVAVKWLKDALDHEVSLDQNEDIILLLLQKIQEQYQQEDFKGEAYEVILGSLSNLLSKRTEEKLYQRSFHLIGAIARNVFRSDHEAEDAQKTMSLIWSIFEKAIAQHHDYAQGIVAVVCALQPDVPESLWLNLLDFYAHVLEAPVLVVSEDVKKKVLNAISVLGLSLSQVEFDGLTTIETEKAVFKKIAYATGSDQSIRFKAPIPYAKLGLETVNHLLKHSNKQVRYRASSLLMNIPLKQNDWSNDLKIRSFRCLKKINRNPQLYEQVLWKSFIQNGYKMYLKEVGVQGDQIEVKREVLEGMMFLLEAFPYADKDYLYEYFDQLYLLLQAGHLPVSLEKNVADMLVDAIERILGPSLKADLPLSAVIRRAFEVSFLLSGYIQDEVVRDDFEGKMKAVLSQSASTITSKMDPKDLQKLREQLPHRMLGASLHHHARLIFLDYWNLLILGPHPSSLLQDERNETLEHMQTLTVDHGETLDDDLALRILTMVETLSVVRDPDFVKSLIDFVLAVWPRMQATKSRVPKILESLVGLEQSSSTRDSSEVSKLCQQLVVRLSWFYRESTALYYRSETLKMLTKCVVYSSSLNSGSSELRGVLLQEVTGLMEMKNLSLKECTDLAAVFIHLGLRSSNERVDIKNIDEALFWSELKDVLLSDRVDVNIQKDILTRLVLRIQSFENRTSFADLFNALVDLKPGLALVSLDLWERYAHKDSLEYASLLGKSLLVFSKCLHPLSQTIKNKIMNLFRSIRRTDIDLDVRFGLYQAGVYPADDEERKRFMDTYRRCNSTQLPLQEFLLTYKVDSHDSLYDWDTNILMDMVCSSKDDQEGRDVALRVMMEKYRLFVLMMHKLTNEVAQPGKTLASVKSEVEQNMQNQKSALATAKTTLNPEIERMRQEVEQANKELLEQEETLQKARDNLYHANEQLRTKTFDPGKSKSSVKREKTTYEGEIANLTRDLETKRGAVNQKIDQLVQKEKELKQATQRFQSTLCYWNAIQMFTCAPGASEQEKWRVFSKRTIFMRDLLRDFLLPRLLEAVKFEMEMASDLGSAILEELAFLYTQPFMIEQRPAILDAFLVLLDQGNSQTVEKTLFVLMDLALSIESMDLKNQLIEALLKVSEQAISPKVRQKAVTVITVILLKSDVSPATMENIIVRFKNIFMSMEEEDAKKGVAQCLVNLAVTKLETFGQDKIEAIIDETMDNRLSKGAPQLRAYLKDILLSWKSRHYNREQHLKWLKWMTLSAAKFIFVAAVGTSIDTLTGFGLRRGGFSEEGDGCWAPLEDLWVDANARRHTLGVLQWDSRESSYRFIFENSVFGWPHQDHERAYAHRVDELVQQWQRVIETNSIPADRWDFEWVVSGAAKSLAYKELDRVVLHPVVFRYPHVLSYVVLHELLRIYGYNDEVELMKKEWQLFQNHSDFQALQNELAELYGEKVLKTAWNNYSLRLDNLMNQSAQPDFASIAWAHVQAAKAA